MKNNENPRILIITRNLPPLVGGMERLNWHMADELTKYAQVRVVGPKGAAAQKPRDVSVAEAPLKPLPLFLAVAFLRGLWTAITWRPQVILAGSGLTAPIAWLLGKLCGARSAAYLHGFDISVNHAVYRKLWHPTFKRLNHVIVNSTPTKQLALEAGVTDAQLSIVFPGVSLPAAPQPPECIAAFREKHGLTGRKILLSVGRLTTRKGLREFVELSLPSIVQAQPDAILVVVGEAPKNSLGAGIQTVESIQAAAAKAGVGENIIFLGVITDPTELATAYEAADVHVFPVRHIPDDPEGFGMVAIEAAAHGLPTVAFATGGVIDAVKSGESGELAEINNYPQFSRKIVSIITNPKPDTSTKYARRFEWSIFGSAVWQSLIVKPLATGARKAHASIDLASRIPKAKKIEILLNIRERFSQQNIRMLEVGCGSGGITHYFATHKSINCEVVGVDVNDNRMVRDGYKFFKVSSVELPFPDSSFDVVITNHVIEHVGEKKAQLEHLREIQRVMAPTGTCYFAVPNRWMITEPHYKLLFLSWLPRSWRTPYLRWRGKGEFYDCKPLQLAETESFLKQSGFVYENISVRAAKTTFVIEQPDSLLTTLICHTPDWLLNIFKPAIPTLIYILKKTSNTGFKEKPERL
ncbi:glycosyltransferase [Marinobacter sp.]|uniref:glycosyltransferase n=1 Tax=Marinobacter sp. TaxID=50741 RepID=UPI003A91BF09